MQRMPLVTVIMPAYNVAPYLRDAIESVVAQTYREWELIVVDDESTDDSAAIAAASAKLDDRIRLIRQKNSGASGARNVAIEAGRGQFFTLLDADDMWDPGFLEAQLDVFTRHPETALVSGSARLLGGARDGEPARPCIPGTPVLTLEEMIADEAAVFIMTTFRRDVVQAIGVFDVSKRRSEDWDFWLRAVGAGFVFRRNWKPLASYRVREGSLSRNTSAMLQEMLHTLGKLRPRCEAGSRARAALDVQVARFERELLLERAKDALEDRRYPDAAAMLQQLRRNGGGALVGITAWLAQHAPHAALAAYRLRSLRPRWLRA
jgi:glycosyltransferase involved in cell wall biosynthesis